MKRIASLVSAAVVGTAALMVLLCLDDTTLRDHSRTQRDALAQSTIPAGSESNAGISSAPQEASGVTSRHAVLIRRPEGPPLIELAATDPQGRSGKVACSTCHSVRKPNFQARSTAALDEFHQGLTFNHGTLACYACHNPDHSDALRLADGSKVEYRDVMTLCSQCHADQATSFRHGAHGGMNGYWDLSRGPQRKNNCIDCHDPHEPHFPKMVVGFKPRDRFSEAGKEHDDHE
ncbi:Doubled CXXCH motif (Paired_CXXCH_1) [Stieleria maiorica]|uniref:Doubled CXXCH motif (Paired_CXXCH_1) n=1 Tax=Stieleria maiorica TaxID=2795974 RepID=A0A5B9MIZ8_9BACT|nr:cytochrome c3 family protein [Stieleria maiorica]QEG01343.1 Doubled CXXCH motif (Paired_CXXCH_1) [Stieleria maiorica]